MKKEDAIRIITSCAKQYHDTLEGKNLLFLFGSPKDPQHFEAAFLPRHFLHFTGVELSPREFISSTDFYDRCLNRSLRPSDFNIPDSGTVEMKLSVLPQMINISKTAKMIGEYSFSKSLLYTEKLTGNVTACVGFVRDDRFYIPNTVLREDIRDITKRPQKRVLAVFKKEMKEPVYSELCYHAKGINLSRIPLPKTVQLATADSSMEPESKRPSVLARLQEPLPTSVQESSIPGRKKHRNDIER